VASSVVAPVVALVLTSVDFSSLTPPL